jgi:hypothetical protein
MDQPGHILADRIQVDALRSAHFDHDHDLNSFHKDSNFRNSRRHAPAIPEI